MILVDTSVWIDYFARKPTQESFLLENMLVANQSLCINGLIEMELLQGARSDFDYRKLQKYLVPFQYFPEIPKRYLDLAGTIYRKCRQNSVTVRKSIDCIIAANAIEEHLAVLQRDRDFEAIQSVFPRLLLVR